MGEVIQLQGDQRKDVQEFLVDKNGLELDAKTIKVSSPLPNFYHPFTHTYKYLGSRVLSISPSAPPYPARTSKTDKSHYWMRPSFFHDFSFSTSSVYTTALLA
jgi:hypothetical protein